MNSANDNAAQFFSTVDGEVQLTPAHSRASDLEWGYIWDNLPQYHNNTQSGMDIMYKVKEVNIPNGYYGKDAQGAVTNTVEAITGTTWTLSLTNYHTPDTTNVTVNKVWDDHNNKEGKRPDRVRVQLYANGQAEGGPVTILPDADGRWSYTWTDLQKYANGREISYLVGELNGNAFISQNGTTADGYTVTYTAEKTSAGDTISTITNSRTPETISISGVKVWDDNNNQDGERPKNITIHLIANDEFYWDADKTRKVGTVELSCGADEVWNEGDLAFAFNDLPKYVNGDLVVYTIVEAQVAGYTRHIEKEADGTYNIINTRTPEKTELHVEKTWHDENNRDGIRPASITVKLFADKVNTGKTLVLQASADASKNWRGHFENLDKNKDGQPIKYTVEEEKDAALKYYEADIHESIPGVVHIVNTYKPTTTSISGTKHWIDNNNEGGVRPESITVKLFADATNDGVQNGVKVAETVATAENDWQYSFTNLPKNDNGQAIVYTVEETVSAALATHYDMDNIKYVKTDDGYDIINTMKQQTFSIFGNKEWVNEAGAKIDAPKDQQIEIALFRDDVIVDTTTASALTDWEFSFTDLPRFALEAEPTADGYAHLYDYRIEELPIDGYIPMYEVTRDNGDVHVVVTNMVCEGQNISVSKIVEGNAPNEQFRFILKVKSTVNVWDAMKVYQKLLLDEAWEEAVEERDEAQKAVQIAENAFRASAAEITTSSAYRLIMTEAVDITSGSTYLYTAYGFKAVNQYGNVVSNGTTGSSYNFMWKHDKVDEGKETGIVQKVINAIKHLAAQFSTMPSDSKFLKALYSEVLFGEVTTPSAIGFVKEDAEHLFDKRHNLLDAEALVQATTEAALKFVEENVTTPTAIKLILLGTGEVVYDSTGKTPNADGFYEVPFELFAGSTFSVNIASTTGAQISYEIVEIFAPTTNYKGTEIYVDNALVSDDALSTGKQILSNDADAVRFHNIYDDPYIPWYPPYIPEDEPEEEPEPTPEEPEDPEEPTVIPSTEIPNEPEEIPDDVVPTGDTNRAVPYMVMMLVGFFGMLFTRKRVK